MAADEKGIFKWFLVAASFIVQSIATSIVYSYGIFYIEYLKKFEWNHLRISCIGAMLMSSAVLGGLPACVLINKLGCRLTVLSGALVSAIPFALSNFLLENFYYILCIRGMVLGLGLGLTILPSILIVHVYFEKSKTLALSLIISGSSLGLAIVPYAILRLKEHSTIINNYSLMGICLLMVPCSLFMTEKGKTTLKLTRGMMDLFDPMLIHHQAFLVLVACNFIWSLGSSIFFMYLPVQGYLTGNGLNRSVYIIIAISITIFIIKPMLTIFNQAATFDHGTAFVFTIVLPVLFTTFCGEASVSYTGQMGYSILFGIHVAFWTTYTRSASQELIGQENLALGKGFIITSIGLGLLVGPIFAGLLLDMLKTTYYVFYLSGMALILAGVIMLIAKLTGCTNVYSDKKVDISETIAFVDNASSTNSTPTESITYNDPLESALYEIMVSGSTVQARRAIATLHIDSKRTDSSFKITKA
ncbi:DgyrCDS13759 [Dimorphilus gyrociliatus]|uniref:DgyrCDS13759 n=1 Tax=Dimorphilus gyrociliatus TaxID=2664684 RepID=A0A7I8WBM0_9ANNE|nr:DgyrCDS13759 [Dimorphilus gyrociliatus]